MQQQFCAGIKTDPFHQHVRVSLTLIIAFSALTIGTEAFACAACEGTLSKDWGSHPGFTADLSYDYLNQNQQRYGSGAASSTLINNQLGQGQEIEAFTITRTVTASFIYTSDNWGVSTQLPFVYRTHGTYGNTAPLGSSYSTSSDSGIGDIRVIGKYSGFSAERNAGIIAGIKLPTGNTGANFSAGTNAGQALDAGLQIGTGSTDIIMGGFYTGTVSSYGWFVQGTVQHAISTKSILGADYRRGDAYSVNTGIRYAGFGAKVSPMLQLNIIKRQADTDNGTGVNVPLDPVTGVPVSGGTLAYLAPGASILVGNGTSVYGFVQLPIYQNVNSLQLTPKYTITLGVRQSF